MSNWFINLNGCGDYEHNATIKSNKIALAEDASNKDLLGVKFILCHEGANLNYDGFFDEELGKSYKTIVNKPINYEHTKENIGVITNSYYLDPSDIQTYMETVSNMGIADLVVGETKKFVLCEGVIWKDKHPERAIDMLESFAKGTLFFSMENWFNEAECSLCGSRFSDLPYCEHLSNRRKTGQAVRYFRDFIFTGAGKVGRPGDPGAKGVSFAKHIEYNDFLSEMDEKDLFLNVKDRLEFANFIDNQLYSFSDCPCESLNDVPQERDSQKLLWLFVCKEKNNELYNKAISALIGDNEMSVKTYTEEELKAELQKAVAEYIKNNETSTKLQEAEAKTQELENSIKEINEKLSKAEKDKEDAVKALAEKEKLIADMEDNKRKDEEFASRILALEKEEIPFDREKVKVLIYGATEDVFTSVKDSLSFAAKYKKEEKKEDKKEDKKQDKGKSNIEDSDDEHKKINEDNSDTSDANLKEDEELKQAFQAVFGLTSLR